jgi:cyclic nucleotide gated channel
MKLRYYTWRDHFNEMLFIIHVTLDYYITNGGRIGFFNSFRIGLGDFCGEELLTCALDTFKCQHPIIYSLI